jgi:hypothetical protein
MQISVSITLAPDDVFEMTPEEAAEAALKTFGANDATDTCYVNIAQAPVMGQAGATPPTPPPAPPPPENGS